VQENHQYNAIIIGAAGYVAPKHMKAIKATGGNLIAALDPHDSVGIIDSYFPNCKFFTEFERFDRYTSKVLDRGESIDYAAIVSPNYLHHSHCLFASRIGANVICEKPMVLNERNLDSLANAEKKYNRKINAILQLRYNPVLTELKQRLQNYDIDPVNVSLDYYTPRGAWYDYSWKSVLEKSGGICMNIGIHLFDVISWLFGKPARIELFQYDARTVKGEITLDNGRERHAVPDVAFSLSIEQGFESMRVLRINHEEYELSYAFTDLHEKSYREILCGRGFGIEDIRMATRITERIRRMQAQGQKVYSFTEAPSSTEM
jgi:UDP-N-acetyl-2-amino-2-deoxyglucuronate dehydrogenase